MIITDKNSLKKQISDSSGLFLVHSKNGYLKITKYIDSKTLNITDADIPVSWRNCDSALSKIQQLIYNFGQINPNTKILDNFFRDPAPYVKYVIIENDELETLVRRFPNDFLYLYINFPALTTKSKQKSKRKEPVSV